MKLELLVIFVFVSVSCLFAQPNNTEIEDLNSMSLEELLNLEICVGAAKATNIFKLPSTVTIIDRLMIKQYGFKDVAEAISVIAGVNTSRTSGRQYIPTLRGILQDHYANKVLIMINGTSTWFPTTNEAFLHRVGINDIERIEILKGPASVIYGTNAYTGAINFVLKESEENTSGAQANLDLNNEYGYGVHFDYHHKKDDFSMFLSANAFDENGMQRGITDDKNVKGNYYDYFNYRNFNAVLNYKEHGLLINGYFSTPQKLGTALNFASALGKSSSFFAYLLNYEYKPRLTDALSLHSGISIDWQKLEAPRDSASYTLFRSSGWRTGLFANLIYDVSPNLNFQVGTSYEFRESIKYVNIDFMKDSVMASNNLNNKSVYEYSVFAQADYKISDFNLLLGTRYTKNEKYDKNISTRGTLLYMIDAKNSIKLIAGQSFRSPSLFEVYFASPTKSLGGNLSIKPETATSVELSYLTSFNNLFFQILGYHAIYENKISRVISPKAILPDGSIGGAKTKIYVNGKKFRANGIEFEGKYQLTGFNVFTNLSVVDGDHGDANKDGNNEVYNFKYVPRFMITSGVSFSPIEDMNCSVLAKYWDKTRGGRSKTIDAQMKLDINISYIHSIAGHSIEHSISSKNILDEDLLTPDYADRTLNELPFDTGRRIYYSIGISLL